MKCIKAKIDTFAQYRLKKGYTLQELSKAVGVHHTTISRLENHETTVRPRVAQKIAEILEAEFDDLFVIAEKGA